MIEGYRADRKMIQKKIKEKKKRLEGLRKRFKQKLQERITQKKEEREVIPETNEN